MNQSPSDPEHGAPDAPPEGVIRLGGRKKKKSRTALPQPKSPTAFTPPIEAPWSQGGLRIDTPSSSSTTEPEQKTSWFYCGRCGSMFETTLGVDLEKHHCPNCGFNPSTGVHGKSQRPESPTPLAIPASNPKPSLGWFGKSHHDKESRKHQNLKVMLQLVAGWFLLTGLIVFAIHKIWSVETPEGPAPVLTTTAAAEDRALLQSEMKECINTFSGFLDSDSPEGRTQFVLSPITSAYRIARFYTLNPSPEFDKLNLNLVDRSVIHFPGSIAIATLWKSNDGQLIEAVFRKQNDDWLLDWDHFVRYSDFPWSLFIAGTGPTEGEFRLLARERLADARKHTDSISIACYPPTFGHPEFTGTQATEFLIDRNSPNGQLLAAAFELQRSGKQVFDSTTPESNPDGMIRLRVKVRRTEDNEGKRSIEITDIIACHWYSIDDPGVQPLSIETK